MAKDRGIIELESGSLPIDWATEETLAKLVDILGAESKRTLPAKREEKKARDESAKMDKEMLAEMKKLLKNSELSDTKQKAIINNLSKSQTLNSKTQTAELTAELKKQGATFFESNAITKEMAKQQRKIALDDNRLMRSLVQAGQAAKKSSAVKTGGTAAKKVLSAVSPGADAGGMAGMAAGFGAFGAGIGAMVGTIQGFVDSTNTAMQTGFSFGDQLIETRVSVADLGMNLQQFSEILAANGDSVRRLGDTGLDAQRNFQQLIRSSMDASDAFGHFGLTGVEAADQLGPIIDVLSKAGVGQSDIMIQAQKTFMGLNQEVMGLAKVTGRDRRELLRQTAAIRGDTLFQSLLGSLGPGAQGAADMIAVNFGVFGESADTFTDLFKNYTTEMKTGIPTLTQTQRQFLSMYPEVAESMRQLSQDFINDPEGAAKSIDNKIMELFNTLDASSVDLASQARNFRAAGNEEMAVYIEALITAQRDAQALKNQSAESLRANKAAMDENTAAQLSLQQNMAEVIQSVQAQFLKLFGVENIEDLAKEEVKDELINKIGLMGDYIVKFRDWIAGWVDTIGKVLGADEEDMKAMPEMGKVLIGLAGLFTLGPVIASVTTGIAAMFAAKAVGAAMAAGASAMFGGGFGGGDGKRQRGGGKFNFLKRMGGGLLGLGGAALGFGGKALGKAGNGVKGLNFGGLGKGLGALTKRIPALAMLLGVGDIAHTAFDDDLTAAQKQEEIGATGGGMAGAMAGGAAGAAIGSFVPVVGNIIGGLIGSALGYYGGEKAGRYAFGEDDSEPLDPDFVPGVSGSTDGYHVPESLNGTVQGATFGPNGEIITGQDPSNSWRFNNNPMAGSTTNSATAPLSSPAQPNNLNASPVIPATAGPTPAEQVKVMTEIRDYLRSIDRKSGDIVENTQ